MYCSNCGFTPPENSSASFCPNCGTPLQQGEYQQYSYTEDAPGADSGTSQQYTYGGYEPYATRSTETPAGEAVKKAAASSLFMALCVTLTVGAFLPLINGGVKLVGILFCIAAWMVFTAATKPAPMPIGGFRVACAAVKVLRIFSWITIVALIAGGTACLIGLSMADINWLMSQLEFEDTALQQWVFDNIDMMGGFMAAFFIGVFYVSAAVILLFNLTFFKQLQIMFRSFYNSVESGVLRLEKVSACYKWLFVIGVLDVISAFNTVTSIGVISALAMAASYIIAAMWLNKNFLQQ